MKRFCFSQRANVDPHHKQEQVLDQGLAQSKTLSINTPLNFNNNSTIQPLSALYGHLSPYFIVFIHSATG